MKNKKIICLIIALALVVAIVFLNKGEKVEKATIEFVCDGGGNEQSYEFYEDEKYVYYYASGGRYLLYNGKRTMIDDALKRGIITMDDVDRAAKENPKCQYDKLPNAEW